MLQIVDNYFFNEIVLKSKKDDITKYINDKNNYYSFTDQNFTNKNKVLIGNQLDIKLSDYLNEKYQNNIIFSFFKAKDKIDNNKDDLIISIKKDEKSYQAQSGNYIGNFVWNTLEINVKSRFSDLVLRRMLNFANDVFLDDVSLFKAVEKETKDTDYSKFIIYYMFIQKLEKAFLLGLPKSYVSVNHHEMKVKGKIDINKFIKYDIPFRGKVSSTSREQKEVQDIIDVLYKAISIIDNQSRNDNVISIQNILHIKTHLKQNRSNKYVSNETIEKAIKSKALQNPIFASYKKVLEYANMIINSNNLEEKKDANKETFGFLVNVAELFEIYLVKLLRLGMPDWDITHDRENELTVYDNQFFSRHMYPDIVMRHKLSNKIMVFDAKYKRMTFNPGGGDGGYGDLDRSDFYQIHSYMSYYNNQTDVDLIAGGLLYPMESNISETEQTDDKKAHADNWFGNSAIKFVVDGIDLSKDSLSTDNIIEREKSFIDRIKILSGEY